MVKKEKKRYYLYPKSFIGKISFYLFGIILASFLATLIFTDSKRETIILLVSAFMVIYLFANIKFFKVEIDNDKVYFPKDKIKFDEDNINFYYYKDNVTDLGDELETPYFVFSKKNVKEVKILTDKTILANSKEHFPEMFYASKENKFVCIEFFEPLTFEKYDSNDYMEVDESLKKIERIYASIKKDTDFIKEFDIPVTKK